MRLAEDAYARVIDQLHDGLCVVDQDGVVTYWNRAAEQVSGYAADEVVGKSCSANILSHIDHDGKSLCGETCPLAATLSDEEPREDEVYMRHKDGHRIPISIRVSSITDTDGSVIGAVELFTDITNQEANRLRVKELERLALLDNLTQLANRHYLEKELRSRFEEQARFNATFGVLFIDIDHFKSVNDAYGHDVGDDVLRFVSKTCVVNARPFDLYGRWGGEEFIGIIRNVGGQDLEMIGNRLRALIEESYMTHGGEKLSVTVSIGSTVSNKNDTIDSLVKRADSLLYGSKEAGRNRVTFG